ncbi:3-keto-5-aminohexanoate cleavage protein [Thermobrachium celere]|uniref:3-keto-5-aminohexanoate cleavage enzyme n=1 Tax=Thermobrachium celere DSM 8682 TaxID=941824 RepID=R7RPL0_9CLOT|nr:3-keto-5-aminohexanoate cleavage protein [Thermobrachium celere]GFR34481.1 3-keto-5-aminohexanoate cleavage enzyme [Thermobrachium celere]CDF57258.1 3-keto-5-aminohexanoate cleavage enzyme [Thermobrachium celere DSM 8682]
MEKLIITCALTGAEVTKEQNPAVPYTVEEMAQSAYEAYKAGASILHIHVREDDGTPTQSKERFKVILDAIREKCPDAILQVTTGGAVGMSDDERLAPVELRPEMATLDAGTINFGDEVFVNSFPSLINFAKKMKEFNVKPEIEVFDRGMVENAKRLLKMGLLEAPLHFDFVLGVPSGMPADIDSLTYMVRSLPEGSTWTVAGIGRYQLPMAVYAILLGGHVRVGLEDNIYYNKGELAKSNAQLVERVVRIAKELGREIATPQEARRILNIK